MPIPLVAAFVAALVQTGPNIAPGNAREIPAKPSTTAGSSQAASPHEGTQVSGLTIPPPGCLTYEEARAYWTKHEGAPGPDAFTVNAALAPGKRHRIGPSPGTEESLRRYFEGLWAGTQGYDGMDSSLASRARDQWGKDRAKVLGRLLRLRFLGVSRWDLDVYEVDWACAKGEWGIAPLAKSGKSTFQIGRLLSYGSVDLLGGSRR